MKLEIRIANLAEELRVEADGDELRLVGYAATFNHLSEDLGGFRERILPGAFRDTLDTGGEVKALVAHDSSKVIGSRKAKTLTLREDETGLRVAIKLPNTTYGKDLAESIRRGDQNKMSFGFATRSDSWKMEGGETIRELIAVDLFEVSAVCWPAYASTSIDIAKRSLDVWKESQGKPDWKESPDLLRRMLDMKRRRTA